MWLNCCRFWNHLVWAWAGPPTYCLEVLQLHQRLLIHDHRTSELAVEGLLDSPVGDHAPQSQNRSGQLAGPARPIHRRPPFQGLWPGTTQRHASLSVSDTALVANKQQTWPKGLAPVKTLAIARLLICQKETFSCSLERMCEGVRTEKFHIVWI